MGRKSYEEGLEDLHERVDELADSSVKRVRWGLEALDERDRELAQKVITGDDVVDDLYMQVEKRCTDILALHQPVARDLRYVTAVFKISTDLERIADLAVNLGEYTERGGGGERLEADVDLGRLGSYALDMVCEAINAFRNEDVQGAIQLIQRDDEMDEMCEEMNNALLDALMKTEDADQELASLVTNDLLAIRDLERVADHAVNISARTVYMVDSDRRYI